MSIVTALENLLAATSGADFTDLRAEQAFNDAVDCAEKALAGPVTPPVRAMPVGEVYIDFATGAIKGECSGCTVADVADAFATIAQQLRHLADTSPGISYYDYDEGKHFCG